MNISIRFTRPTIKLSIQHLKQAYAAGDVRSLRSISALLGPAKGETVAQVAEMLSVCRNRLQLVDGFHAAWHRQPDLLLVARAQAAPDQDAEETSD